MEFTSPLINLAILETLKSNDVSDDIDLFLPIVAVAISGIEEIPFSAESVQSSLKEMFGFDVPIAAVQIILARAKKRKLIKIENHAYLPCSDVIEQWRDNYDNNRYDIESSLRRLRESFVGFVLNKYHKEIDEKYADTVLYDYLIKNVTTVTEIAKVKRSGFDLSIKNKGHLVADFIVHLFSNDKVLWSDLERVVRGTILANYMTYADRVSSKTSYKNISVYLDTPVVLGLLGFSGPMKQKMFVELVELLDSLSIGLLVFDITIKEIEGILYAWKMDLESRNYARFNPKTLELLRHNGIDAARIETLITLLESDLEKHNISISRGFNIAVRHHCDQTGLEAKIKHEYKGKYVDPVHDATAVARVHNQRRSEKIKDFNSQFSLFVTTNMALSDITCNFFPENNGSIPFVVTDKWLTTAFWLKHPDTYKNLPTDLLVSTAYSTVYADDAFWSSFVGRLESLAKRNEISHEDFVLVRYDSNILTRVHEESVDKGLEFTDKDVFDLIDEVTQRHKHDGERKIQEVVSDRDNLSKELLELKSSLRRKAEKKAKFWSFLISAVLLLSIGYSIVYFLPDNLGLNGTTGSSSVLSMKTILLTIAYVAVSAASLYGVKPIHEWIFPRLMVVFDDAE